MRRSIVIAGLIVLAACSREQARQATVTAKAKVQKVTQKAVDAVTTPNYAPETSTQSREQQRFDERWRQLQSFRAQQALQQQRAARQQPQAQIQFVQGRKESFKGLDANGINTAPVLVPIQGDMSGPSVLKAQVYLDRAHFSVGVIDGQWGKNSAVAVWWWQQSNGMQPTGEVDEATFRSLADAAGAVPALVSHVVTADDLQGPFVQIPSVVYDQAKLDCLCYESVREKLAERFHVAQDFLGQLNPGVKFSALQAGQTITVPNVRDPLTTDHHDIAKVVISISGNSFNAYDGSGNVIFHAPTTVGSTYDPSPDETVKVVKILWDPHFHYDPTLYHEVPDWKPDAELKPGPNSPVGVVWVALSKEHYGIHGTSEPDSIGYVSSHGCVRLTNWDATEFGHRVSEGVMISFVDTQR